MALCDVASHSVEEMAAVRAQVDNAPWSKPNWSDSESDHD